jgi:hypothetical protein
MSAAPMYVKQRMYMQAVQAMQYSATRPLPTTHEWGEDSSHRQWAVGIIGAASYTNAYMTIF